MTTAQNAQLSEFHECLDAPELTQQATLARILRQNARTAFGEAYAFGDIATEREFRDRVPIHSYEELRPYIEREIATGRAELCAHSPMIYARTSGTTGKPKLVPFCAETLEAFRRIQSISTHIHEQTAPGIYSGKVLAIVSPMVEGSLSNGRPVGAMSGVLKNSLPQAIVARSVLDDTALAALALDAEQRFRLIAAIAVCEADITCLASANPSTLLRLAEVIGANFARILALAATGDAAELGLPDSPELSRMIAAHCSPSAERLAELRGSGTSFETLWPRLRGAMTWTSGNCGVLLPKLAKLLSPAIPILEMGYLASEFLGTVIAEPHSNTGAPTIADNFFEFIEPAAWDAGSRDTLLLHELTHGRHYYIIATTPDGLYRYFINDIVEVTGRLRDTATIGFVQKGKGVTSLTGEKLYEGHVIEAVRATSALLGLELDAFIMVADRAAFSYTLYIETKFTPDLARIALALDDALAATNIEYAAKVRSRRLPIAAVKQVQAGTFDAARRAAIFAGQRAGQFKTISLQYADELAFSFKEHTC